MKSGHKSLSFMLVALLILLTEWYTHPSRRPATDTDGDGYFSQGGACGAVDCDDNKSGNKAWSNRDM